MATLAALASGLEMAVKVRGGAEIARTVKKKNKEMGEARRGVETRGLES